MRKTYFVFCVVVFTLGLSVYAASSLLQSPKNERVLDSPGSDASKGASSGASGEAFANRMMEITYLVTRSDSSGLIKKSLRTRYVDADESWREVWHGSDEDTLLDVSPKGAAMLRVRSGDSREGRVSAESKAANPASTLHGTTPDKEKGRRFHTPSYLAAKTSKTDALLGYKIYADHQTLDDPNGPYSTMETWYAAEVGFTPVKTVIVKVGPEGYRIVIEAVKIDFR